MSATDQPIRPAGIDIASASLAEIAQAVADKRLPPVDKWEPAHCGDSDMRIAADGTWYHQGSPIGRQALVQLFSTVLRREADGSYVLVTPVEKLRIEVVDAPFVAVELTSSGEGRARTLVFRLNTDDVVIAGPDHPLRIATGPGGAPRPYVRARGTAARPLDALLTRAVFYQLADLALAEAGDGDSPPGLWSGGSFFALTD